MKKNNLSNRSTKFVKRNAPNFENVREYISNLCDNVFDIHNYKYQNYIDDELALWIDDKYIIYLDYDLIELKLLINGFIYKVFRGDGCWYQCLKYINEEQNK